MMDIKKVGGLVEIEADIKKIKTDKVKCNLGGHKKNLADKVKFRRTTDNVRRTK